MMRLGGVALIGVLAAACGSTSLGDDDQAGASEDALSAPFTVITRAVSFVREPSDFNLSLERPSLSTRGQFVAFSTTKRGLTPQTPGINGQRVVYVYDASTGRNTAMSLLPSGAVSVSASAAAISGNGRSVAFIAIDGDRALFVRDRLSGAMTRIAAVPSVDGGGVYYATPSLSEDGRKIAFASAANDLVANDTNGKKDVFVRDLDTLETKRVSVSSSGVEGDGDATYARLSSNGRFVAFTSNSRNLIDGAPTSVEGTRVFLHDLLTGETTCLSDVFPFPSADGPAAISANGRFVAFGEGLSGQIVVRDRLSGTTAVASVDATGAPLPSDFYPGRPDLSADGRYVSFNANGDTYVTDLSAGRSRIVSTGEGGSGAGHSRYVSALSGDGSRVVFASDAATLAANDTIDNDLFLTKAR